MNKKNRNAFAEKDNGKPTRRTKPPFFFIDSAFASFTVSD